MVATGVGAEVEPRLDRGSRVNGFERYPCNHDAGLWPETLYHQAVCMIKVALYIGESFYTIGNGEFMTPEVAIQSISILCFEICIANMLEEQDSSSDKSQPFHLRVWLAKCLDFPFLPLMITKGEQKSDQC